MLMESLLFGKWSSEGVKITDISLTKHILLTAKQIPHSFGKTANQAFAKDKISIVERLVNKLMRSGQGKRKLSGKYIRGRGACGKKLQSMRIVEDAFTKIEAQSKQNPLQMLVLAIEHAAPREDVTRLQKGGISYTVAVDISPMKRIDDSLKNIALAAFSQSFSSKMSAEDALAKEIALASKDDSASFSIKRRNEVERIALGSR